MSIEDVGAAGRLPCMPEQSRMTPVKARKLLWIISATVAIFVFGFISLVIYGFAHPVRHMVLLLLLGTVICPVFFTILLRKTSFRGLFDHDSVVDQTSIQTALRRNPTIFIVFPMVITSVVWGFLLVTLGMKEGGDHKAWVKSHSVLTVLWIMTPKVVAAYLLVALHATYIGMYVAGCIVYATVMSAVGGIKLENGVIGFFGKYKAQASPLVVLSFALLCAASFGILHFAVWSMWPSEYLNMHGIGDAIYFSVVTMATVGYGDILPVGHAARALCLSEILSGVLLLVVGVSASMTVWLQTNQPVSGNNPNGSKYPLAQEANGPPKPAEPIDS
jgi:hypothetical protein